MLRANGLAPLTIIKKNSTLDRARVLDPALVVIKMVRKLNGLFGKLVLRLNHPKPASIMQV